VKIAFTSATINYLPRAFTLAQSFIRFNPDYRFLIFLLDSADDTTKPFQAQNIHIVSIVGERIADLEQLSHRLSISEISFTLKPLLSVYLLDKYPDLETAFYFDADICVYHSLYDAELMLQNHDFVITPHFLNPIEDNYMPTELDILRTGLYNMGFAGFRNNANARLILNWWKDRVLKFGYENHDLGLTADQMWMSIAPLLFPNVGIIRHLGYNFAYWNVHERALTKHEEMVMVNEKYPLVFIHFADFDPEISHQFSNPGHFNRKVNAGKELLTELSATYAESLNSNHFSVYAGIKPKYSKSPARRSLKQLSKSQPVGEWLKGFAILVFSLLPSFMRFSIRKFSLFYLRNIK